MATAGIVEYESGRGAFRLPAEHAAMVTRAAGPNNFACFAQLIPLCAGVEDELVDKFRHGGGVPYSSYPRFHETMAEMSGAIFDAGLVETTLPLVPGLIAKLDGSVKFDFMTTFDAVHDQADPQGMVDGIYRSLKPDSYWLCVDVQGSSYVGENLNHPMGTFIYSVSCQHCMTVSLAYDGVGLGAMWGVQKAREIFGNAGFDKIDIQSLPADPLNNYYICHRPA